MAERNFDARDFFDKKRPERSEFISAVLYSKQLIYDVAESQSGPKETVKRHESLTQPYDRQDCAIDVGLVYLVSRFDNWLNRVFSTLWGSRRDMLHDWIADQLPRVTAEKQGRVKKRGGEPALTVALAHLWQGKYRHVSVQDYFEGEIHDIWSMKSPNEKYDALVKILDPQIKPDVVALYEEALERRNKFIHPKDHDWPTRAQKRKETTGRMRPELKHEWYEEVCEAFLSIVEEIGRKRRAATSRNIATNIENIRQLLSVRQQIALGTYLMNSGQFKKPIEDLLQRVDKWSIEENSPPEIMVLATSPDLAGKAAVLREFAKKHPKLSIVLYEWPWADGLRGPELKELADLAKGSTQCTFIPDRSYPGGKYDAKYDSKEALQRKIKEATKL